MKTGYVESFNDKRGYGFIIDDATGESYFLHYSNIVVKGKEYKTIEEGQRVEFESKQGQRGVEAVNVKKVD